MKRLKLKLTIVISILFMSFDVRAQNGSIGGHEYIDLGLSVKWASVNLGAISPEDYGNYYAWAETSPKYYFTEDNYKWYTSGSWFTFTRKITKYNSQEEYGTVDNKIVLELSDDAANASWGNGWRIPNDNEIQELIDKCTWTYTTINGIKGYSIKGTTGNSIFLPFAGAYSGSSCYYMGQEGWYWSATHQSDFSENNAQAAHMLDLFSSTKYISNAARYYGLTIRPVIKAQSTNHEYVDLNLPSGTLWATCNVGANTPEEYGNYYAWGETQDDQAYPIGSKNNFTWTNYQFCRGSYDTLTKYNTIYLFGSVDNKIVLESTDDVATVKWGSDWRMPTNDEFQELVDQCTWVWTTQNGANGCLVIGTNGNYIFLPAGGEMYPTIWNVGKYGYYWTSTLHNGNCHCAYGPYLKDSGHGIGMPDRCDGRNVRPVYKLNTSINEIEQTLDYNKRIFHVDGREIEELQPGINIIKYSNGQIKKVLKR